MLRQAVFQQRDPEAQAIDGLLALIEQVVESRVRPLEETIEALRSQSANAVETEEYLDVEHLAERIHKPVGTIRDWIAKRRTNKIPAIKMPTGGWIFAWSEFESWMRGDES